MVDITERLRLNGTDWVFGETAQAAMKEIITLRKRVTEKETLIAELVEALENEREYQQQNCDSIAPWITQALEKVGK